MTDNEILDSIYCDAADGMTMLINSYADLVYKVVYDVLSDVGTQEDIQDCVCDTFAAFFNNIDDADLSRGSIKGFLGVIARRRAINLRFTLNPDDETVFDEYTVEEMSEALENEDVLKSPGLAEIIVRQCLKEIAPEMSEQAPKQNIEDDEFVSETEEAEEELEQEPEEEVYREPRATDGKPVVEVKGGRSSAFGRAIKTLVAMVTLVAVIVVAVIAFDRLSVPDYVPPTTTQPTTQAEPFNPLISAITAGNEKLIEELITNSLLLSQDVLKFAVEYADKISYDSIRRIAEEVRNKYGSTGLDPLLEGAIFGDLQTVTDELKNKDESEMTPSEKLALFFINSIEGYSFQQ